MHGPGFDALTRTFTEARSRRGLAQVLLGAALGGAPALLALEDATAKRGKNRKRRKQRDQRRRDHDASQRDGVQADKKKKPCPPCKKRKKGKCKGKLPDGAACPGGRCRAGSCVATTPPVCTPSCGKRVCGGDNGCGKSCGACTGGLTCQDGQCVLVCNTGLTDCSGDCVDLETDADNCGECGEPCSFAHASAICQGGVCKLGACNAGFANCDGDPETGCETDTRDDVAHCGGCEHACDAPPHATATCANSTCGFTCDAGFHQCGDACVSDDDIAHCGSSCTPCPTSVCSPATCNGTTCGRAPIAGCCEQDADCGDSNACTTDTCGDNHTCQHSDVICTTSDPCQDPICDPGLGCITLDHCSATEVCITDGAQAHCCPPSQSRWNGSTCVECLPGDVQYCPKPPNATAICTAQGECSYICEFGWGDCGTGDGCETDLRFNTSNCGECGRVCTGGQICNGRCFCPGELTWCTNICADLEGDPVNCGACGNTCDAGDVCQGGNCTSTPWINETTFGAYGSGPGQLDFPKGFAISGDYLTVLVADTENHRISIWTRPGASTPQWTWQSSFGSGPGSDTDELRTPYDIALSGDGLTAAIADMSNGRISVWTRSSLESFDWTNQTTFGSIGSDPDQFGLAVGVTMTADGRTIFVADEDYDRIAVWTRSTASSTDWTSQTTFGGTGSGSSRLSSPSNTHISGDELIVYVADTSKERIAVWTRSSAGSTDWSLHSSFGTWGQGFDAFDYPEGIFVSADNLTAFVSDVSPDRISIWTRNNADSTTWTHQTTFGSSGTDANHLGFPRGIVASADGTTLFIVDSANNRISVWVRP